MPKETANGRGLFTADLFDVLNRIAVDDEDVIPATIRLGMIVNVPILTIGRDLI